MTSPTRYFEDLEIGECFTSRSRIVTESEITDFAKLYDPQYFHVDPTAAASHPQFGEVVASGIHILAVWRQLDHEITGDIHWICGIEWKHLRWNKPLRAGDEVRARAELVDKQESSQRKDRGVVEYRYSMLNQDDDEIFYCLSRNLVECRPQQDQAANGQ